MVLSMYELGEKIRTAREAKNYSQVQLAKRIGRSPSMISGYESSAKTPATETLIQIADVLEVSLDYLAGHDKKQSVAVEGLTKRQIDTVLTLVAEFREQRNFPAKGLTQRQQDILNNLMIEFGSR